MCFSFPPLFVIRFCCLHFCSLMFQTCSTEKVNQILLIIYMIRQNFDNRPIVVRKCRKLLSYTIQYHRRNSKENGKCIVHTNHSQQKAKTKPTNRKAFAWVRWNDSSSTWAMGAIWNNFEIVLSINTPPIHPHARTHAHTYGYQMQYTKQIIQRE